MGQTFDMCVLQDFEALTPNIMCRTMETVRGGGIIIILLKTVSSLNQLYNLTMDVHKKFVNRDEDANSMFQVIKPRFCERLILSLTQCSSCMITDDELNVLPLTHNQAGKLEIPEKTETTADNQLESLRSGFADSKVLSALLGICITLDQADCLGEIGSYFASGVLKSGCIAVTSGRGRGKSAALGLTVALALVYGLRNIFVTSPAPDNVATLFEFLSRGLLALGYSENVDFIRVMGAAEEYREAEESLVINSHDQAGSRTSGPREYVVGIDLPKTNQRVKYMSPRDIKLLTMADTLLIDEAAAIPLHTLRSLIDNTYLSIMATTVDGYEGTGKALSIQLLNHLQDKDGFKLIQLNQAIRYAANDPIEAWLQDLLCLKTCQMEPVSCPQKQSSKFVKVNRDALFCYHPISEIMLADIQSLFTWSNYRNSPDDLFTMSDAPNVDLFALVVADRDCLSPKILAAIEVAYEAGFVYQAARKHNRSETIDSYVSWTIANYFTEPEFASLTGVRITKIGAVTLEFREKVVAFLLDFFRQQSTDDSATTTASEDSLSEAETPLTSARVSLKSEVPALLKVGELPILDFDWCSSTFDLDESGLRFWTSKDFTPVWIGQSVNDITRLHPCITLHQLRDPSGENRQWADLFKINFARRFLCWLSGPFKVMKTRVVLLIIQHAIKLRELLSKSEFDPRVSWLYLKISDFTDLTHTGLREPFEVPRGGKRRFVFSNCSRTALLSCPAVFQRSAWSSQRVTDNTSNSFGIMLTRKIR